MKDSVNLLHLIECAVEHLETRSPEERVVLFRAIADIHPDEETSARARQTAEAIRTAERMQLELVRELAQREIELQR